MGRAGTAILLGLVVALAGLPASGGAVADGCRTEPARGIDRVAGADRFATAACTSAVAYPDGAAHVLVARGDAGGGLADALAGAVLAHAVDGPLLLTLPDALPDATRAELERLAPATVTILGAEEAVGPGVEAELVALADEVHRLGGRDRHETAAVISEAAGAAGVAFVVNGHRPADALVAAAPAARAGALLLQVGRDRVPAVTEEALDAVGEVVVVGGHGVVSAEVEARLRELTGGAVRRVAGGDRFETAAAVARAFPTAGRVHLGNGADRHLVDAVTAGWAAALPGGGPVLYAERDRPGRGADRYLRLGGLAGRDVRLVGGSAALSGALVDALADRLGEAAAGGPTPEVRGIWVHLFDPALKSRAGIHAVLDAAAAANLNTVIVQVARRHDAYYTSAVLPRTVDPEMAVDLDLLAELAPAARDRGLSLHAWVSVLPAYHAVYDDLTLPSDHVWRRHGPGTSQEWTTRHRDGRSGVFLDPGVPGVQDHVAAVLAELAGRYDVDAVHVDYLRYEGEAWGYNATALARYRAQAGTSGTPEPGDAAWGTWRRRQTGDLARRIRLEVAAADADVAVSLAASTMGQGPSASGGYTSTRTYADVFQDWPGWLSSGRIDAAFPMNYFREPSHGSWLDDWLAFERPLAAEHVVAVGQAAYLNSVRDSLAQLARARDATDGVVLFSHQQDSAGEAQGALRDALAAGPFAEPAPAPHLVPPATHGHILARAADGVPVEVVATDTGVSRTVTADATGHAGFIRISPGRWTVTAAGYAAVTVDVSAGAVSRVELRP